MALALCLTLLPTAALAEETEGTAQTSPAMEESTDPANGEAKQEKQPAEAKQEGQPAEAKQESQSAEAKQENQPAEQEEQQEDSAAKQDKTVAAVQAMIDALPDAEALDGMGLDYPAGNSIQRNGSRSGKQHASFFCFPNLYSGFESGTDEE